MVTWFQYLIGILSFYEVEYKIVQFCCYDRHKISLKLFRKRVNNINLTEIFYKTLTFVATQNPNA